MEAFDTNTMDRLRDITSWNGFAASLVRQYDAKGDLSVPQWQAAERMLAKIDANKAKKDKMTVAVDMSGIDALFSASKLKKPKFLFGSLTLTKAGPHSRNPGAIYVHDAGDYSGKIVGGKFMPVASCDEGVPGTLGDVAAGVAKDGTAFLAKYGKTAGVCACCGASLTSDKPGPDGKTSKERGIGPVCAANMGLL